MHVYTNGKENFQLANGYISTTTILFKKFDIQVKIEAEGYVEYYKNNQCVASFDLEKEAEGKKVYTEVVCHTTDNEIILEFPIVKWIDNYPHCDGEHDRWDCVILGYHQVNFDVNENKVSKPSR